VAEKSCELRFSTLGTLVHFRHSSTLISLISGRFRKELPACFWWLVHPRILPDSSDDLDSSDEFIGAIFDLPISFVNILSVFLFMLYIAAKFGGIL
jgi:hypothetical protein